MKKTLKSTVLMLLLLVCACALAACGGGGDDTKDDGWKPSGVDVIIVEKSGEASYTCVYAEGDAVAVFGAEEFHDYLLENSLPRVPRLSGSSNEHDNEILFGDTGRLASTVALEYLTEKSGGDTTDLHWVFHYRNGKLAIAANSDIAYETAIRKFFETYFDGTKISVIDSLKEHGKMTRADYDEWVEEQERLAAEALKAERDAMLAELLPLYEAQSEEIEKGKLFGTATAVIGKSNWPAAPTTPIDEHPRLFITADNLDQVRESLKAGSKTNVRFKQLLSSVSETDGKLGEPQKDFRDRKGLHNYDNRVLELIQVKALGYLIEGHELFGYQAIYYMKNFLLTLDIQYISSDQCREYGNVMMTAACVYDWCYDLLTEEDKAQFIAGVETRTASGNCGDPSYTSNATYKRKMEVGFPPSAQGALAGHGAEGQILRNYLAASIAFYGDNNSWWDYVAARIYGEYVPIRNYYYQSGISQQGTGLYIGARHTADLFSAWLIKSATGDMPYENLDKTIRNFLGYECAPDKLFTDGDGSYETKPYSVVQHMSYMSAYLFEDEEMLKWADDIMGLGGFTFETSALTSALYVALRGLSDIEPAKNRYEGMSLIQYNGHPVGQYIIREAWNSEESAAVFMRIKELSTGNHEHQDAGTFEIYYKGMLTSDGGCYNTYGKPQTKYFHQSTISHNGLIVFDSSKWDYNSSDLSKKWYSGGQIAPGNPSPLDNWLSTPENKTGTVTGRQHGYSDAKETQPLYAYIAGDITAAYPSDTVEYVGRRMLTVYTGDEEFPMAFFVYDDITSDKAQHEKRFLLQISSKTAPTIDTKEQTIITENGEGRLVLTCLSDDVSFREAGGRNTGAYSAKLSMNYCINGYQILPESNTVDDKHWGRVEIYSSPKSASKNASFMNVIYVTDAGNEDMPKVDDLSKENGVTGGVFDRKIAAIFATSRERATTELSCKTSGSGNLSYYVSGVAAGKWKVTVDDKSIGTFEATEEGGLLTFTAPAGVIKITPEK